MDTKETKALQSALDDAEMVVMQAKAEAYDLLRRRVAAALFGRYPLVVGRPGTGLVGLSTWEASSQILPKTDQPPAEEPEPAPEPDLAPEPEPAPEPAPEPPPESKRRGRRPRGRAVAKPVEEEMESTPATTAATPDVQAATAPEDVQEGLGTIEPNPAGTLEDLFPDATV